MIECVYMAESEFLPAGHAVGSYCGYLRHILNIPPDAEARVNGVIVGDEYVPGEGSTLEWIKTNGEKGLPWWGAAEAARNFHKSRKKLKQKLEEHAKECPLSALPTKPSNPNQPQILYSADAMEKALAEDDKTTRFKPPPCPECGGDKYRVTSKPTGIRYLKCKQCGRTGKKEIRPACPGQSSKKSGFIGPFAVRVAEGGFYDILNRDGNVVCSKVEEPNMEIIVQLLNSAYLHGNLP